MSETKNYTREEYVFLAKLYEKAEKFSEMFKYINKFVELEPKLSKDERIILESGYKNLVNDKRSSWRILNNMEKREERKNSSQIIYIKEAKENVEKELNQIYDEIQKIIDKYLISNAPDSENKAFYLRLKGDYYRYKCEISNGKDFEDACSKAEKVYKEAYELANICLSISNSIRLGCALNYSVFNYEIKKLKEEAINIAKNAFDESMEVLDDLEISKAVDTLPSIQLLKENLIFWCTEMNEEEN